jgi:hypothetical protein
MSVTRKHSLWAVKADTVIVGGITQQSLRLGGEITTEPTSGEPWARFQYVRQRRPGASFTTKAIADALDAFLTTGLDISTVSGGLILYAQAFADGGTRTSGSAHRSYTMTKGVAAVRRLECTFGQDATLSVEAVPKMDGSNDPLIEADAVALPAGIADNERFTLGPITLESIVLPQIRSMEIDFGIDVVAEGADSDLAPTHVSIRQIVPTLTLRGIDVEWLKAANIPRAGKAVTQANTKIYLRKRTQDGAAFVIDGTAEHIKLTAAGLAHIETAMDASGNEGAEATLIMPIKYDGTNAPIVVDTTSAIV